MATFYLDFEGGNDANDGTTFANRWKNITSGATAARITAGDTIRVMGSPAPTSLGQTAVWTSAKMPDTKTVTGATNATPISITCVGHGYSTGDLVMIDSVAGNTNANGTWDITVTGTDTFTLDGSTGNAAYTSGGVVRLRNNQRIKLTTAVTQTIASTGPGRTTWISSANATTALATSQFKEHSVSEQIGVNNGFTTGKVAYWTLPATLNLSSYQQVSFWIRQLNGVIGALGSIDLRLCSDTLGATAVNTVVIPVLGPGSNWQCCTVDLGTNLGSSIRSIAFYINTDNAAQTFQLNNIIACKASSSADSLTLTSLISKNTAGETWWSIQSINGTRVILDADAGSLPGATTTEMRGYYGTSETVTTWKRETIKLTPASSTTAIQTVQAGGTTGSLITFSGGWDRTNMSTQNLETWLDGQVPGGYAISGNSLPYVSFQNIAFTRFYGGLTLLGANNQFDIIAANNCSGTGLDTDNANLLPSTIGHIVACTSGGLSGYSGQLSLNHSILSIGGTVNLVANGNANGVLISTVGPPSQSNFKKGSGAGLIANCTNFGIRAATGASISSITTQDNDSGGLGIALTGSAYCFNCKFNDSTSSSFVTKPNNSFVQMQDADQVAGNNKIYMYGALISAATDQRHTASGVSWKIQPTNTNRTSDFPIILPLAKVAVAASSLVTVKAWMRRDNTGLTMQLVCRGNQIAGVTSNVTSSVTTTNAWEELTITFTPSATGVVDITAEIWGGTTYSGWVDDMTISQA